MLFGSSGWKSRNDESASPTAAIASSSESIGRATSPPSAPLVWDDRDRCGQLARRDQPVGRLERGCRIDQTNGPDFITPFLD
jgi:hypothetical protein